MNCTFSAITAGSCCNNEGCGYRLKYDYPSHPARWCDADPRKPKTNRVRRHGLGDYVAWSLSVIGVTPARYVAAKKLLGFDPSCGCAKRQAWLNRLTQRTVK